MYFNKIQFVSLLLLGACFTILVTGCKKKKSILDDKEPAELITTDLKSGLPDNPELISGYLYCANRKNFSNSFSSSGQLYAAFHDPDAHLLSSYNHDMPVSFFSPIAGNVSVNSLFFNDVSVSPVNQGNRFFYNQAYSSQSNLNLTQRWKLSGNTTFTPLEISLTRGFPVIVNTFTNTSQNYTLSLSNGFQFNAGLYVSNYDSVVVSFSSGSGFGSGDKLIRKSEPAGAGIISFSSNDLSVLSPNSSVVLQIAAYNYATKTENNKIYIFENAELLSGYMTAYP